MSEKQKKYYFQSVLFVDSIIISFFISFSLTMLLISLLPVDLRGFDVQIKSWVTGNYIRFIVPALFSILNIFFIERLITKIDFKSKILRAVLMGLSFLLFACTFLYCKSFWRLP